jgi:hypothetical protein
MWDVGLSRCRLIPSATISFVPILTTIAAKGAAGLEAASAMARRMNRSCKGSSLIAGRGLFLAYGGPSTRAKGLSALRAGRVVLVHYPMRGISPTPPYPTIEASEAGNSTMVRSPPSHLRHLVIVLGDQLDPKSSLLDGLDVRHDAVWMAEVAEESTRVWSHKARIAVFLAAMRHYRDATRERGIPVLYRQLDDPGNLGSLARELEAAVRLCRPHRLLVVEPGEWRVKESIEQMARKLRVPVEMREDRHFLCTHDEFAEHAAERKQLRMEYFYRHMRRKTGILLHEGQPEGGKWNFDQENRGSFGSEGPQGVREPLRFSPDTTTREVLTLVEKTFASHPGRLDQFAWPVTPRDLVDNVARPWPFGRPLWLRAKLVKCVSHRRNSCSENVGHWRRSVALVVPLA